jgi:hypothetical protein
MPRLNVGGYYKTKDGKTLRFAGMKDDTKGVFLDKSGDYTYVSVDEVEKFGDGGEVGEQNKQMLMNQAVEFKHHAEELMKVLEKNEKIDAWVVAKAERATTDLSDITHYLDGRSRKMKWGGMYAEGGELDEENEMAEFDLDSFLRYIYPNVKDAVEMNGLDIDEEFIISKDMSVGYLPHYMYEHIDGKVNEFLISYFDAEDGLIGDIHIDLDTKSIKLKFPDWGIMNNSKYAKGGKVPMSDVTEMIELAQSMKRSDVRKAKMMFDNLTPAQKKDFKRQLDEGDAADEGIYEGFLYLISDENPFYEDGGMMGMGGATFSDKVKSISGSLEGRSVPSGYRSQYGRRYNKSEAKEAAQRIAGSMRKKGY